jgi:hypothetical protein
MRLVLPFTAVPCPKCNARVGQPCRSASGQKLAVRHSHVERARAFGLKFPKTITGKLPASNKTAVSG